MNKRIRTWWHVKTPGEKRAIITLSILLLILFYWYGLYMPIEQRIQALQIRCQKLQTDRQWLDKKVTAAGLLPEKAPNDGLQNRLEELLKKKNLIATLTTTPEGRVDVSAVRMTPATFMQWLYSLQAEQGLRIDFLEFHASDDSNIILTRLSAGAPKNGG